MIRTLSIIAGGFLGFAGALTLVNSPTVKSYNAVIFDTVRTTVTHGTVETEISARPAMPAVQAAPVAASKPVEERTAERATDITSDIYRVQFALARIDCFEGAIDGRWTPLFHERLSRIVLASELDLEQSGAMDQLLDTIGSSDPDICADAPTDATLLLTEDEDETSGDAHEQLAADLPEPDLITIAVLDTPVRKPVAKPISEIAQSTLKPAAAPTAVERVVKVGAEARTVLQSTDTPAPQETASVRRRAQTRVAVAQSRTRYVWPPQPERHPQVASVREPSETVAAVATPVERISVVVEVLPTVSSSALVENTASVPEAGPTMAEPSGEVRPIASLAKSASVVAVPSVVSRPDNRLAAVAPSVTSMPSTVTDFLPLPSAPRYYNGARTAPVVPKVHAALAPERPMEDESVPAVSETIETVQVPDEDDTAAIPLPVRKTASLIRVFGSEAAALADARDQSVKTLRRQKVRVLRKPRKTATTAARPKPKAVSKAKSGWKNNRGAIFKTRR